MNYQNILYFCPFLPPPPLPPPPLSLVQDVYSPHICPSPLLALIFQFSKSKKPARVRREWAGRGRRLGLLLVFLGIFTPPSPAPLFLPLSFPI